MEKPQKPRVITPLPAPKLMDLPMFQGEHRESLCGVLTGLKLFWSSCKCANEQGELRTCMDPVLDIPLHTCEVIRNGATDVAKSMAIGVDAS
ncbi:hypothetical protein HAX54_014991 [Datura stramonium]|uniref:Uncharacterized protein n=1 Tax=Datura stramonium TaxID=4076 RepID=A0ABS8TRT4_DATST|nr:hypothetical protein [Datura stramonium]